MLARTRPAKQEIGGRADRHNLGRRRDRALGREFGQERPGLPPEEDAQPMNRSLEARLERGNVGLRLGQERPSPWV